MAIIILADEQGLPDPASVRRRVFEMCKNIKTQLTKTVQDCSRLKKDQLDDFKAYARTTARKLSSIRSAVKSAVGLDEYGALVTDLRKISQDLKARRADIVGGEEAQKIRRLLAGPRRRG